MAGNIVSFCNVSYKYPTGTLALNKVNLDIPAGKKIALLGENGAGKSTLMLLMNGILQPSEGHLCFKDEKYSYSKISLRKLRAKVGLLFNEPDNQLIAPTVFEEISFGLNNLSKDKEWVINKVNMAIEDFCLQNISHRSPHELSDGQKKKVCLASVLAMEPKLIVCDEPASSLDPKNTKLTFEYLDNLNELGKTIMISTHDVNMAYTWADHIIILSNGKVMASGSPKEVLSQKKMLTEAGLSLPYKSSTVQSLIPETTTKNLPLNMQDLKGLLKAITNVN